MSMNIANLPIGYIFGGRYSVVREVGVGGMSVVYGAYDLNTGNTVALKVLDLSSCETDEARAEAEKRFVTEAMIMKRLSHSNIVNICGTSEAGEPPYFVMEYVEANTLKCRIDECGALTFEETIYYTKQILDALIHAHDRGVIHCDLKPQNIMLFPDGNIKLTDFGIARMVDSEENRESDTAVGTVYYISPEQASGRRLDGRSDIYSLGVMMYEMATGKLPFSAEDTSAVSRMHIEKTPLRPKVLDPEINTGLEQIILHAMEKAQFMRFSDAKAMLDAVEMLERDPDTVFDFNRQPDDEDTSGGSRAQVVSNDPGASGWVFALLGVAAAFIIALIVTLILIFALSGENLPIEPVREALNEGIEFYGIQS